MKVIATVCIVVVCWRAGSHLHTVKNRRYHKVFGWLTVHIFLIEAFAFRLDGVVSWDGGAISTVRSSKPKAVRDTDEPDARAYRWPYVLAISQGGWCFHGIRRIYWTMV